eukprot:363674-Chlamydomonas_euryale.AAC.4
MSERLAACLESEAAREAGILDPLRQLRLQQLLSHMRAAASAAAPHTWAAASAAAPPHLGDRPSHTHLGRRKPSSEQQFVGRLCANELCHDHGPVLGHWDAELDLRSEIGQVWAGWRGSGVGQV